MLDWDKPLAEQAFDIQKLKSLGGPRAQTFFNQQLQKDPDYLNKLTGERLYKLVAAFDSPGQTYGHEGLPMLTTKGRTAQGRASEALRQIGVPGIRYLDRGSRSAGEGTRNFVVFPGEEGSLTIKSKE